MTQLENSTRSSMRTPRSLTVERWLESMSVEDKIGQMSQIDINVLLGEDGAGGKRIDPQVVEKWIGKAGIGSVLNTVSVPWTAEQYRSAAMLIQQTAEDYHRPPVIWGLDSVHGANYVHGAIVSPQPINLAATFNLTTAEQAGRLASRDTRAAGINWLFSPLLGIAIEPKWSRVYETFGEDPHLVGEMAQAMTDGIQAPDEDPTAIPSAAAACAKHFVGYSAPHNGHDRSPSWIPTRHLYQYFVPPWKKVARKTLTVMESYTETDGVPNVGNRQSTDYLLRNRLGFDGVLVTDYEEMLNLHNWHHVTGRDGDAVVDSLRESTIDMSMIPWDPQGYRTAIEDGLHAHWLDEARLTASAQRVLKLKEQLRMFDEKLVEEDVNLGKVGTDEAVVLDMVRQSIVLAKNDNATLPLRPSVDRRPKVVVTGPTSSSLRYQSGGWTWQWQGAPNDEDWFTYGNTLVGAFSSETTLDVSYRCGVDILGGECDDVDNGADDSVVEHLEEWVGLGGPKNSIARTIHAISDADVVIIGVGEENYTEKPGDIRSLRLPSGQYDLVRAIRANTDAKIVLVYFGGRPRLLEDMVEASDAVLLGFLSGPSAGQAVADIVMGRYNPNARLPITYPKYEDNGGVPYFHSLSDQCTRGDGPMPHYEYIECEVLWPFGHGLSYTDFEYSNLQASGGIDQDLEVSVTVTNTGDMAGAHSVLFFTFDEFRRTTPEYKRLRAFHKVHLEPGASVVVKKTVELEEMKFVGPHDDRHYIIDPTMISWAGVGTETNCRTEPATNPLCAKLESSRPDQVYIGACDAACDLWATSGCADGYGLSSKSCLSMCTSIAQYPAASMNQNNDGWGWDYVSCLESVLWGAQVKQGAANAAPDCWEMTAMCRDIFSTGNLNEFGLGPGPSGGASGMHEHVPIANMIALITALIASAVMIFLMNGGKVRRRLEEGDIQFARLPAAEPELPE